MASHGGWRLFGLADSGAPVPPGAPPPLLREGLLGWAASQPGGAALILNRFDLLPVALRAGVWELVNSGAFRRVDAMGRPTGPPVPAGRLRLYITTESALPEAPGPAAQSAVLTVKVPPLRVRRQDIVPTAAYLLRRRLMGDLVAARGAGGGGDARPSPMVPSLSAEGRRLLEGYEFAANIAELEARPGRQKSALSPRYPRAVRGLSARFPRRSSCCARCATPATRA